ncbi:MULTISPECIES: sulfate transporter family protein [unclassified Methylobacterium]|uniref:sulfate transporter family protein n=1 Tax=unclassified Methylobacterium TaxID=2615210 RepID=UPI001FBBB662|nr:MULTISPECIES: sulfate transporter family protein [unclassified Methylobacterium]MCJ2018716.1 sulfate transporter family protein [Methylobacterium sp. E-065]
MLVESAAAALRQTFSPPLRAILWKSLGLTLGLLVLVWFGLTRLVQAFQASHHISSQYPILDTLAYYFAGFGLFVALAYLMPAISILVAGFFLDDAAEIVERTDFPGDPPGRAMPLGTAMLYAVRFAGVTLLVNLAALVIFFVPVIGIVAFFAANAYLLAREYFEMAAARFRPLPEAAAMRRAFSVRTLGAGCLLSAMMVVPIVNLLTPLFGIALMVHLHKRLSRNLRLAAPGTPERVMRP